MNWKRWGAILSVLCLIWLWQQWPDGKLRVVFCDVGQGDAALVVFGSFQALVDTGPSEHKLFECMASEMPFWDRSIDLVFISHPQSDHNGALEGLRKRFKIGKVVENVYANDAYRYGNLYFDILSGVEADDGSEGVSGTDENEDSMVILLKYFSFSVLFTADIGAPTELALLDRGVLKKLTALKVPHHGSKFSSTSLFLEKLRPEVAVVSVGAKNSYGHPSSDTLMRLEGVGAVVLRTDLQGSVSLEFSEKEMKIFSER